MCPSRKGIFCLNTAFSAGSYPRRSAATPAVAFSQAAGANPCAALRLRQGYGGTGVLEQNLPFLDGGIMAWDGRKVAYYPRVQVFDKSKSLSELLLITMDLEKGALRFYDYLKDRPVSDRFSKTMGKLSKAEITHAKVVYSQWRAYEQNPPKILKKSGLFGSFFGVDFSGVSR